LQKYNSKEGAKMVGGFFQQLGDYGSALQFLILSGCTQDALSLAQTHNKMDVYADVIGDSASEADFAVIAHYFEGKHDRMQAGKYYLKANDYNKVCRSSYSALVYYTRATYASLNPLNSLFFFFDTSCTLILVFLSCAQAVKNLLLASHPEGQHIELVIEAVSRHSHQ
jgi:hypothetical protein